MSKNFRYSKITLLKIVIVSALKFIPVAHASESNLLHETCSTDTTKFNTPDNRSHGGNIIFSSRINVPYKYGRGVKLYQEEKYSKAYKAFFQVLKVKPFDASSNFYVANIFSIRGDHKKAIKHYSRVQKQYPNSSQILCKLGVSYALLGKNKQAKEVVSSLKKSENTCIENCSQIRMAIKILEDTSPE